MTPEAIAAYDAFAARVLETEILTDPWVDGRPRLRAQPVIIDASMERELHRVGEQIAAVHNEVCLLAADDDALLDSFFSLSPWQKAMWLSSKPMWHGIARADVFETDEGLTITELNSDTPTGEAEAVILNSLVAPDHPDLRDPNAGLGARFLEMVEAVFARLPAGLPRTAGLVYPTEITEDLSLVRLYRKWLETAGWEVVLGSPYNLSLGDDGSALLFDVPFSILVRHYKTDWWGERAAVWDDAEIPDSRPLSDELGVILAAELSDKLAVINPFGAVLSQNKRIMAFMWERIHRLSPFAQDVVRRYVPVTRRLEVCDRDQLLAERREWVLKSDYGAEGEEVILGRDVSEEVWAASILHARKGRWIAQRYFAARANAAGETMNHGVYLVAGQAAGLYGRVQKGATDVHAESAPVLVRP
jgi:glutathionylspermidine synthase